jgi:hypothetical protein
MKRILIKLSTRRCNGTCGDTSPHDSHLTAIGLRRYTSR